MQPGMPYPQQMPFTQGMKQQPNYYPPQGYKPNPKFEKTKGSTYSVDADVEALNKAMKGVGTNESAIIQILCNRTSIQRQQIKAAFNQKYNKDLVQELKKELSGKFEDAIVEVLRSPTELDCKALYEAMHGAGTDEETLIEIICTRSNYQLNLDKQEFSKLYKKDLVKFVESETSGIFKKILLGFLQCNRSENIYPDPGFCQQEAERLYKAGEGRWGTDEDFFAKIITQRSPYELAIIADLYHKQTKHTIFKAIDKEFSGQTEKLLNQIVMAIIHPSEYFANRIYNSMKGAGTKDKQLIRCLVSRDEVDMPQIKECYKRMFEKDMIEAIKSETSGDYEKFLVELCGH